MRALSRRQVNIRARLAALHEPRPRPEGLLGIAAAFLIAATWHARVAPTDGPTGPERRRRSRVQVRNQLAFGLRDQVL